MDGENQILMLVAQKRFSLYVQYTDGALYQRRRYQATTSKKLLRAIFQVLVVLGAKIAL